MNCINHSVLNHCSTQLADPPGQCQHVKEVHPILVREHHNTMN